MPLIPALWDRTGGALLVRDGTAGRLTTLGRISGTPRTIQCGFLRREDGSILVGSATGRQWPRNLVATGWCEFEARELPRGRYDVRPLDGAERDRAVAEFRVARGARAAAMFSGLVFLLTPAG